MNNLYNNLVGAGVEYNDMKKAEHREQFEKALQLSKLKISRELNDIYFSHNKLLQVVALAEMVNFYEAQTFALSIRSHINLKRNKKKVTQYLEITPQERQEKLIKMLSTAKFEREVVLIAVMYFVGVYKNRLVNFKSYLTKEEYIYVA